MENSGIRIFLYQELINAGLNLSNLWKVVFYDVVSCFNGSASNKGSRNGPPWKLGEISP